MRVLVIAAACFAFCITEAAQPPVSQTKSSDHALSVTVERVNVPFTVAGRKGKFVLNLKKEDFQVFEDDEPQSITNFSRDTDLPLNIALLVDTSGSIRPELPFEKEAARKFFYSVLRPGKDKALIVTFDSAVTLLQDYTDDSAVLARAVRKIISGGSTSLYDAVCRAAYLLAGQAGKHVVIILSDGMDNTSRTSLAKTLEIAQKHDVVIYAVSTNEIEGPPSEEQKTGDANLKQLTMETGGRVLFPAKIQDLTSSFYLIGEELRSQYSLAYRPTNNRPDGTYRQIRIVSSHKHYKVRSRTGYFAPGTAPG